MIGDILGKVRKSRGYSLRKLAKLSGLSHGFISDIENGRCNPSIESLLKIADALEVKPHIFLDETVAINDHKETKDESQTA